MIVYFAGAAGFLDRSPLIRSVLISFAYPDDIKAVAGKLGAQVKHLFVDSGAFTAATKGARVDISSYADWVRGVQTECQRCHAVFTYANLDVMGDQAATWANQRSLERRGLAPVPILTYGCERADIRRAVENYPYIALGGLVPHAHGRKTLTAWFDVVYSFVYDRWRRTGDMTRLHWFGFISRWAGVRWPVWSADSRAWMAYERRGPFLHEWLHKQNNGGRNVTDHRARAKQLCAIVTREKIEEQIATERMVSATWENRKIVWASLEQPRESSRCRGRGSPTSSRTRGTRTG